MGVLKGVIHSKMDYAQRLLPVGSVVKLFIFLVPKSQRTLQRSSGAGSQPRLIGKCEIHNVSTFPIEYSIDYEEGSHLGPSDDMLIYLNVYIEKNGTIMFNNESHSQKEIIINSPSKSRSPPLSSTSTNRLVMGNEFGDLVGRNGKVRRHLDVFLNTLLDNDHQ